MSVLLKDVVLNASAEILPCFFNRGDLFVINPLVLIAKRVLCLRKMENFMRRIMNVFETAQAVTKPRWCYVIGFSIPSLELADLIFDMGNQRVWSARKTDGSNVMRHGWMVGMFVREWKGAPENADHFCYFNLNFMGLLVDWRELQRIALSPGIILYF